MEDDKKYFYDYILKVSAIAKTGLTFTKDPFALENYKEINNLSTEMLKDFMKVDFSRPSYFKRDIYPTPSVSVRTVILSEDKTKVLMVKETYSDGYSLPGGWCDLFISSVDNAKKECFEEAGIKLKNISLVGVINRIPFKSSVSIPEYVVVYKAEQDGDFLKPCHEVSEVKYFDINNLPKLCRKMTLEETKKMIDAAVNNKNLFE